MLGRRILTCLTFCSFIACARPAHAAPPNQIGAAGASTTVQLPTFGLDMNLIMLAPPGAAEGHALQLADPGDGCRPHLVRRLDTS